MDHFKRLKGQIKNIAFLAIAGNTLVLAGLVWFLSVIELSTFLTVIVIIAVGILYALIASGMLAKVALRPLQFVWQSVLHLSAEQNVSAPNLDELKIGHDLVHSLVTQVYQFASQQNSQDLIEHRKQIIQSASIVSRLPLPLFVFNKEQLVTNASTSGLEYCGIESSQLFGKPLHESVKLEFATDNTLEKWLTECQEQKVTDTAYWEHVRVQVSEDGKYRQCDIAAYYNRDNPSGTEFIVTLLDRTEKYEQEDQSLSFISVAVHELRTPLTMLRGYIEIFEEELTDSLDDEMKAFMHKMQSSAQQLTAFVNNILNVAKVEQNQLQLHLSEENWAKTLQAACGDMEMRAQLHGIAINYQIDDKLPTVGIDKVSIYEVVYNLLDNAIKYAGNGKEITVASRLNKEGSVETTITDHGVGIPSSVIPNLFERFYRNHRTKGQVGGSGLGLFLCKSIISAHGGQIWAQSKEGEGSTFGFTLLPYSKLADEQKTGDNSGIVRNAHGWIKNHSLYRG